MKDDVFGGYNFSSLSLADLLAARDQYHYHLMNKRNVVGTAIGRYLIRNKEEWPKHVGDDAAQHNKLTYPRTLTNSQVRDYSWPCVLVFVRKWEGPEAFAKDPSKAVPLTLYLPDGRAVPVCAVLVDAVNGDYVDSAVPIPLPQTKFGGGLPISVTVQHEEHMATAGCLVSDGHLTYALTARHVTGDAGTPVSAQLKHGKTLIGEGSGKQLTRHLFSKVYPDFPGRKSYLTLDVGLIELADVTAWTSNIYGLPPIGQLADFYEQNLTLRLIDHQVVAMGAASGLLQGKIKALFYRYSSIGGYDYVADFLIAPEEGTASTRHGDSGAIWHLDVSKNPKTPMLKRDLRPLAVEWGGQTFDTSGSRSNFAVATSLSNVCKLQDIEIVTNNESGVSGYWGRTGHYSIARLAIDEVKNSSLSALLKANRELMSFDVDTIAAKGFSTKDAKAETRLADVPDDVWKHQPSHGKFPKPGGRDTGSNSGPEHPNHFADVDVPYKNSTLRALCLAQPNTYLTPVSWKAYYAYLHNHYAQIGDKQGATDAARSDKQGLLPFRVWQIVDQMINFARGKQYKEFVCAAGILAHYVGDGSQPLHASYLADGDRSRPVDRQSKDRQGNMQQEHYGQGSHSAYESDMLDVVAGAGLLFKEIDKNLPSSGSLPPISNGKDAAKAMIQLMDDVAKILPPQTILDVFETVPAFHTKALATRLAMWKKLGPQTGQVMALGVRYLGHIWNSAWEAAGAPKAAAKTYTSKDMSDLYIRDDFLKSYTLDQIGPVLAGPPAAGAAAAGSGLGKKKKKQPTAKGAKKKAAKNKPAR